jgi:hypothetical protein
MPHPARSSVSFFQFLCHNPAMAGATGEPPGGPDQPDDIDERLREIEAELRRPAKFIEPSAAERAGKPRLRDRRKAKKLRKPVPERAPAPAPDHWRSGPAQPQRASRAHGRAWSLLIAVIVIAGLAVAGIELPKLAMHKTPAVADNTPVKNGATPASRPSASATHPSPTLAAPFLGTPAQSYADGRAGIVIPPVHAVGSYTAAQVMAAYRKTRKLLIAANLNGPTLAGGAPNAFAGLLTTQQRADFVNGLNKIGVNAHGLPRSTRGWVTSFAPGTTQLVGNVIKVHGSMAAAPAMNGQWHVLQIHADYLFVYAVQEPGNPATLMRIVVRSVVDDDFAAYDDPGGPLEPWWLLEGGGTAGARCDVHDGFVHPEFHGGPPDKVKPTGAPVNPYDQNTPPAKNVACQATTGT